LNKFIKVFLLIIVGFSFLSCSTTKETTTITYLDLDYSDFEGQFITDVSDQINMPDDDYYVYYYGIYCHACNLIKAQVLDTFYRANNDTIYFVEVNSFYDIAYESGVNGTPTIIHVVDNEIVGFYEGRTSILAMIDEIN